MPSNDVPHRINGYIVFPVALPPLPSFAQGATHFFYIRPHEPKQPDAATARSLFLANVPFDSNGALLKHLLSEQLNLPAGRVQEVRFTDARSNASATERISDGVGAGKKRKRELEEVAEGAIDIDLPPTWDRTIHGAGTNAVVVFVDRSSRDAALRAIKNLTQQGTVVTWGEGLRREIPELGVQRYLAHRELSYPPKQLLIDTVNDYMTAFAEREEAQARLAARKRQEPDADGFVTVSRGGRMNAATAAQAAHRLEKEKSKRKGFDDFYRFQFREKKKMQAANLIQQFEADRAKIQKMREQRRKFQPE